MFATLEISTTSNLAKKTTNDEDAFVNIIILLNSNVPCRIDFASIYLDNPTDFPPNPVLVEALSETLDELPSSLPSIRRHASDGMATFSPELKKDKILEFNAVTPIKIINKSIFVFHLQFPSSVFNGFHHFEGTFINTDSQEKTRFTLQLPTGYYDGLGHVVLGSLHSFPNLITIPTLFHDLTLSLNYILELLFVQRLLFQNKIWIGSTITNYLWNQIISRHENPKIILLEVLQVLSSLIRQNKFRHGDFGIVLIGQLLDHYSSEIIPLDAGDCDSLYSAPLKLLTSGLEIFQKYSKSEASQQSMMDSPTFATFRYIRIALNYLLNQDLNAHFPSFQSCRVVIPLILKYQQFFSNQTNKQIFRYGSRDCWGFLDQLDALQTSLNLFHERTSTFFQGTVIPSNLLQTRDLLDNQNDRESEFQMFISLLSSLTSLVETQSDFLTRVPDHSQLSNLRPETENNALFIREVIVSAFDLLVNTRNLMNDAVHKYLRLLKKIQQTDSTHIPSFRRLWNYQEFKSLTGKYSQLTNMRTTEDGFESKTDTSPSNNQVPLNFSFVTPWAGSGFKGRPYDAGGERSLIFATALNNPGCLAVRTDTEGNPIYSGGIDEQAGHVYLSDVLNHSIRVLIKPRQIYTLIGNSSGSSGSAIGPLSSASLHTPRGLCTHDVYDQTGSRKTLLIIADSVNNCLKGVVIDRTETTNNQGKKCTVVLPKNELFPINAKSETPGEPNTLGNPTGVCSLGDTLYVCCRGDHTLRAFSFRKKGWTGRIVAGKIAESGCVDGLTGESRLSHPVSCTSANGVVYFIEQGRIPAVKSFDGTQVKTILLGSPLKNITDLCAGEKGNLLICDRGNSCIWQLHIETGDIIAIVTSADVCVDDDSNLPLVPSGIVKVADGAYLFSDISRHQVFRFMTSACAYDAMQAASLTYSSLEDLASLSCQTITDYLTNARNLKNNLMHGVTRIWRTKEAILNYHYSIELPRFASFIDQKSIPKEGVSYLLRNAPSFVGVELLLRSIPVAPDTLLKLQEALTLFVQDYDFSSPLINVESEVHALTKIFLSASPIAGQDLFCKILKDDRFQCPISLSTLKLLAAILLQVDWSTDRALVMDLRREVTRWLNRVFPVNSLPSSSVESHAEVLILTLRQWIIFKNDHFHNNSSKEETALKALEWIIRIHLDSHSFGFVNISNKVLDSSGNVIEEGIQLDRSVLTLQCASRICKMSTIYNYQCFIPIFADTCSDVARTLNPSIAFKLLIESLDAVCATDVEVSINDDEAEQLSYVTQQVVMDLIAAQYFIVEKKIEQRLDIQYSKAKKWATIEELQELENRKRHPPVWEFYQELLTYEPELWGTLLHWSRSDHLSRSRSFTKYLESVTSLAQRIEKILLSLNENAIRGHITVDLLRKVYASREQLLLGWQSLGCEFAIPGYIDTLETEVQNSFLSLKSAVKILNVLASESILSTDTQAAVNNWSALTLNTVRILLRIPLPSLHSDYTDSFIEFHGVEFSRRIRSYPPLPEIFLRALDSLLLSTEKVDFFSNLWFTHCNGEITDENLTFAYQAWINFFNNLVSGDVTYGTLESFSKFLFDINELSVLVQTCAEGHNWTYLEKNSPKVQEIISALQSKLSRWRKVQKLVQSRDYLLNIVEAASQSVLSESGISDIQKWSVQLESLCQAVRESGEWNTQTLSNLEKYWEFADILDENMLRVSFKLLTAIRDNTPLLTFMRIIRDDNAFTSSLEVALGLQEMECPAELWDSDHGRVDERYLSMARNIRSYLYNFLYNYPPALGSTRTFLEVFATLNESMSPEVIAENILECNRVRDAFMEIMQFRAEGASSSRLLKLYEPKCRSHWKLMYSSGKSRKGKEKGSLQLEINAENQQLLGHELHLEYVTITGNLDAVEKEQSHALPELLDFQSNVVLSKEGDLLGGTFQETVDKFLHQLGWVRKLREVLSQLSAAGHFSYHPFYSVSISAQLDDDYFVHEVTKAKETLQQWTNQIALMRRQYYFLNFIDIKRCYSLLSALQKFPNNFPFDDQSNFETFPAFKDVEIIIRSFLSFINADMAASDNLLSQVTTHFCSMWFSERHSESIDDTHLEPLCRCLQQCCESVPPRLRSVVTQFDLEEYVTLPTLKNGTVYTMCTLTSKMELEQALTLYIARGVWPEWETCLLCSKHTTLEMVTNFIHRWKSSHVNNRPNRLYYLISCHSLPYHIQETISHLIREFLFESSFTTKSTDLTLGPLVLSCKGEAHSNPLIALFQNMNLSPSVLPDHLISQIFHHEPHERQVEVYSGRLPGCGKSFRILSKASIESNSYVYVPVNSVINTPVERKLLIDRIIKASQSYNTHNSTPLYHFDIANTINETFAAFLFEFCVLGVVPDFEGETVVSPPPNSAICIELAATLLETTLPHCRVYPIKLCKTSRDMFQYSPEALLRGMGQHFSSPLYDGTWKISASKTTPANAFSRLQYVATALNILRHARGTFPYQFSLKEPSESTLHKVTHYAVPSRNSSANVTLELKEKQGESKLQQAQQQAFESLLMTGHGLNGQIVFDLLFDAMTNSIIQEVGSEQTITQTQENTHLSLWCIWNFVNVVYWQLTEMHHLDSPLNGACMPDGNAADRTLEEDTRTKRKIKGEIIQFILRTAVEFATRQSKLKPFSDSIVEVNVTGMRRSIFNKRWRRMEYDNDGKPCFRSSCGNFYLYYRGLAACWVIDDIIETSGSTYAYSSTDDINSTWTSSPEWSRSSVIESSYETTSNSTAYRGEAIRITGCSRLGGKTYCSATEDGLYLRQPPYDDINGQPHYIKFTSASDPLRRHLFFATERRWIVAPQCNEDQGYFIMGESCPASRNWMYLPPDEIERQTSFTYIKRGGADNQKPQSVRTEDGGGGGNDSQVNEFDIELVRWKDSNHECILFNNVAHTVAFLSARPKEMKNRLHPMLLRHLEQNSISVEGGTGRDDSFASSHWKTLSALTGIFKDDRQASQILDGSYCLTGDSLLKILAIVYRVTCGIPVVLLGECGCGKTMLLRFLCAWMNVKLLCLDVHGGTTEADILGIFSQATEILESHADQKSVFVFLDEINTCGHMGLITEAICHRSLNGDRLHEGIQILAALNPYRVRPTKSEENFDAGLEYTKPQMKTDLVESNMNIDMKHLVYKVHPIPPTLRDFIFDFGSLDDETESLYVQSMLTNQLSSFTNVDERSILADMISRSQIYLREYEGDPSVVSLRDVQRCLDLLQWFYVKVGVGKAREATGVKVVISPLCRSAVLAIAHVYGYRLPSTESRKSFYSMLTSMIKRWGKIAVRVNFDALGRNGFVQTVLENMQRKFVNNLTIEPTIAMNQALTENLFVTIICILNKIPIFIVGKPGTSKTLAIQIIASNLQGKLSPMPLWKNFPAVYIFQYQCSPLSTSASILYQYESAKSYQEHSEDVMTVLLLDEVGLAENSPDMPLKVLHYMLVDPPIAIVGLSNWALDSSKMNRAVCLQRPEPSAEDIMFTGQNIVGSAAATLTDDGSGTSQSKSQLQPWLMSLARAFHSLYSNQKKFFGSHSRNFIGMRDYYSLLKYLRDQSNCAIDPESLALAVARNFGGRPDAMQSVLELFHKSCFDNSLHCPPCPPSLELIQRNLSSFNSRHLMILSANDAALQLLIGCQILSPSSTTVLVGSRFKDDLHELHIIQQINQVKNAMAKGQVVTLLHNESMFESLYDVLNQRYVFKTDIETGIERKMLRLALGPRSQLCPVAEGFKLIVIVDQQHAYDSLDLPLLNRFEKQVLYPRDLLHSDGAVLALNLLSKWCDQLLHETNCRNLSEIFCGYYSDTLSSLVLNISSFSKLVIVETHPKQNEILLEEVVQRGKELLSRVAFPSAILLSSTLRNEISHLYHIEDTEQFGCLIPQSHLFGLLEHEFNSQISSQYFFITTRSPISHFHPAFQKWLDSVSYFDQSNFRILQLALLSSERQFLSELNEFLQYGSFGKEDKKTLIILCDPLLCDSALISHARYLCARRETEIAEKKYLRNIVFVIHLPPGVSSRQREFILDIHPPWQYRFVDDIRFSEELTRFSLTDLLQQSPFDLYSKSDIFFEEALWGNIHTALTRCVAPKHRLQPGEVSSIKVVKDLLQIPIFYNFLKNAILECLQVASEQDSDDSKPLHVKIACSAYDKSGGTLRESLLLGLDCLFIQSFAHVIRTLDVDFNLHHLHQQLLMDSFPILLSNWIEIANKVIGKNLSKTCALVSPNSSEYYANCLTRNNGLHGVFFCKFPFSEKIAFIIGNDNTRFQIESVVQSDSEQQHQLFQMSQSISSFLDSIFGGTESDSSSPLLHFLESNPLGYLHDFVEITLHPFPGISDHVYFDLMKLIIDYHSPTGLKLYTPSMIHACYWTYERILFHIFSVLSIISTEINRLSLTQYCPSKVDIWLLNIFHTLSGDSVTEKIVIGLLNYLLKALLACANNDFNLSNHGFQGIISFLRIIRKAFPHLRLLLRECLFHQNDQTMTRILAPYWRMSYTYLVLKEFISFFECHRKEVYRGQIDLSLILLLLQNLLEMHEHATPQDPDLLNSFSTRCRDLSTLLPTLANNFLRCFIIEYVQYEHDFLSQISTTAVYSTNILHQLGVLVATLPNTFLSVRRSIVWLLSNLLTQSHRTDAQDARRILSNIVSDGTTNGSEAALIYINHLEDSIATNLAGNLDISLDLLITFGHLSDRNEFLHFLSSHAPLLFKAFAVMKSLIRQYSFNLANYLSSTSLLDHQFPPIFDDNLSLLLAESEDARFFLLKCLRDVGGNDLLLNYLHRQSNHPYLPQQVKLIGDSKKASRKLSYLNPFPYIFGKDQYLMACDVFKQSILTSQDRQLISWIKNHRTKLQNLSSLIAAIHTELTPGDGVGSLSGYLNNLNALYHNAYYGQVNESDVISLITNWVIQLERSPNKSKYDHNLEQLLIHVGIIAVQFPQSLTAAAIHDVSHLTRMFLPGMPQNEMSILARAMGYVGWYQCPNGHPYTVGECTYPMEESRCSAPGCGALIGGRNHNAATGTVRLGAGPQAETIGYIAIPENDDESNITKLILRFYLHCSFYLSTLNRRNRKVVSKILGFADNQSSTTALENSLRELLERDYSKLKLKTQFSDDDLCMALHQVFKACSIPEIMNIDLRQSVNRHQFDEHFQRIGVDPIFAARRSLELIQAVREENSGATTTLILHECFHSHWGRMTDTVPVKKQQNEELTSEEILGYLWRLREPLTFNGFLRKFSLNSTNNRRYPVLASVLEHETVLPYIKHIADILAWHAFLFSVLPPTTTREQAAIWTLADVLNSMVPENRRHEGWTKMRAFCTAFNESFPLVGFLYECNANPFITNDGRVDLSGGKRGGEDVCMNENSTLNFSLPSSSHGETDATGLCTLRLLTTLQDYHNRIVGVLNEIQEVNEQTRDEAGPQDDDDDDENDESKDDKSRNLRKILRETPVVRAGMTPALRAQTQAQANLTNNNKTAETPNTTELTNPLVRIPVTSLRTSTELVKQRLLIYDREKILMPIVAAATDQSMKPGCGRVLDYDFRRINADLRETLLATSSPLALHIFQFQYAGEIRKSGGLRGLGAKSKQIPLSAALLEEIWKEIDTQNRLTKLLALLEGCIAFIVASGATQLTDGDVLLEDYVLGTLLMNPKKWEEIRCPSLAQHVHLHHLQCLFLDLEQRNGLDPLSHVALAYREPIPDELKTQLRHVLLKIDFSIFTPILREFCTEQLSTGTWPSDGSLKEFIGYSTEVDLDPLQWFAEIPEELQLRHAYEMYNIAANPGTFLAA